MTPENTRTWSVIISSMGADDPPDDQESFSVYLRAKHDADAAVRSASGRSDLAHTIVRPGQLTDNESTGSVRLAESAEPEETARADVAEVLAELIDSGHGRNTTFEAISGSSAIADAVRGLDGLSMPTNG